MGSVNSGVQYLVSSGEDMAAIVWRTKDWQEDARITTPFEGCKAQSFFRRLDWAPDGLHLCVTHAFKAPSQVASILNRDSWREEGQEQGGGGGGGVSESKKAVELVGHRAPIVASRYNPALFVKARGTKLTKQSNPPTSCCAIGTQDASLSVWMAGKGRPLAIINNAFDRSISDLAWSPDGTTLLAASLDGTLCGESK